MDEVKHATLVIVLPRGHHHLGDGFPDGQCVGLEGVDVCGGIIPAGSFLNSRHIKHQAEAPQLSFHVRETLVRLKLLAVGFFFDSLNDLGLPLALDTSSGKRYGF